MRSSLTPGKSATPPARCIHRSLRDTSSAEYRLLVSSASVISPERSEPRKRSLEVCASREPESRRSPALAPHTCAISPTFRFGAFFFVASALADVPSSRLTLPATDLPRANLQSLHDSILHDSVHLTLSTLTAHNLSLTASLTFHCYGFAEIYIFKMLGNGAKTNCGKWYNMRHEVCC